VSRYVLLLAHLHIVYGASIFARRCLSVVVCRLSASVTLHGGPTGGFARAGQAMTSYRLQSNYSATVTLHSGPVVLRPVRVTPCFLDHSSKHERPQGMCAIFESTCVG